MSPTAVLPPLPFSSMEGFTLPDVAEVPRHSPLSAVYTVNEFAALLNVDRHHILDLIHVGSIHAIDIAKPTATLARWRIPTSELSRLLARPTD